MTVGPATSVAAVVPSAAVARGSVLETVSASGNIEAPSQVGLDFQTGGRIQAINVAVGQSVQTGQVLAQVDPAIADAQLASAQASLAAALAALAKLQQGPTATQLHVNVAQLAQAANQVHSAQTAQNDTRNVIAAADAGTAQQISNAQAQVAMSQQQLAVDQSAVAAACKTTAAQAGCTQAEQRVAQDTAALNQANTALANATSAQQQQAAKDQQTLDQAQAAVSQAQAAQALAVANAAAAVAPASSAAIAQAQAQVQSAQLAVTQAQTAVAGTTLTAPQAGTVASITGVVGQQIGTGSSGASSAAQSASSSSGSSGGSGAGASVSTAATTSSSTGFITLTQLSNLNVQASFAETDAAKLQVGQPVTVTVNALPNQLIAGTVVSIAPTGTMSSGVVDFPVVISLTNPPAALRPGQSVTAQVVVAQANSVLEVPAAAVQTLAGRNTVTVVDPGGAQHRVVVQVGVRGTADVQIVQGLTAGQRVSTSAGVGAGGFPGGGFPGLGGGLLGGGGRGGGAARSGG